MNINAFSQSDYYKVALVMIFIHLVKIKKYDNIIEQLITILDPEYYVDFKNYKANFVELSFLQYRATYYHTHHQNDKAITILEYIGIVCPNNNKNFSANNNYLLTSAYISAGKIDKATDACKNATDVALQTNNYTRFLYCQMNLARIYSCTARFTEAVEIISKLSQKNVSA